MATAFLIVAMVGFIVALAGSSYLLLIQLAKTGR